jgi:hypothetical protein
MDATDNRFYREKTSPEGVAAIAALDTALLKLFEERDANPDHAMMAMAHVVARLLATMPLHAALTALQNFIAYTLGAEARVRALQAAKEKRDG